MKLIGKCLIAISLLVPNFCTSNSVDKVEREVLVYIKAGCIDLPQEHKGIMQLSTITFKTNSLKQYLQSFDILSMEKAFPDFEDRDTIKFLPDGTRVQVPLFSRIFKVRLDNKAQIEDFINRSKSIREIGFAEKNYTPIEEFTNDPDYNKQWYLKNTGQWGGTAGADVKMEGAWSIYSGSYTTNIGILDAGVLLSHLDLVGHSYGVIFPRN